MAIQVRRGNYADLNTSRLVQGEPFVTLDKTDGDYYVGMAIAPSNVVRLATWDNLVTIRDDCEAYRDECKENRDDAVQSANNASISEINADDYCTRSETAWNNIDNAMQVITPSMSVDFTTGILSYEGSFFDFNIDSNGHLNWGIAI